MVIKIVRDGSACHLSQALRGRFSTSNSHFDAEAPSCENCWGLFFADIS
jgi:hypothetical protein